jgi:hypothetical protein
MVRRVARVAITSAVRIAPAAASADVVMDWNGTTVAGAGGREDAAAVGAGGRGRAVGRRRSRRIAAQRSDRSARDGPALVPGRSNQHNHERCSSPRGPPPRGGALQLCSTGNQS